MNRSLVQACLLVVLGTLLITTTAAHRNTRQAGRCGAGQQCILLTSCPELLALLNPPTSAGIRHLQSLTCTFDRRNPKVCCDAAGSVTPTTTSTTTPGDLKSNILPEQCGAIGQRVFGGDELPVRSYMWMALIGFGRRSDPNWGCGGSLISKRYVITAAHCNDKFLNGGHNIVRIRLGEHDLSKTRDCQRTNIGEECAPPVQDFNPESIIMHPTWNKRTTYSDDIALIRLDRPAQFHSYVQPICLPSSTLDVSSFLKGREAEVAGWGSTEIQHRSNVKLMVKLPFVPLESCRRVNHLPLLEKGQVCFGGVKGKDSCSGDSGGPLVSTDSDAKSNNLYVLLGVVSYGPPLSSSQPFCGIENRPGVYTDVAQYRNWIVSQLQP